MKNNWPGTTPYLAGYWCAAWGGECDPNVDEAYNAEYLRGYEDYIKRQEKEDGRKMFNM